jgi:hypothetical protein
MCMSNLPIEFDENGDPHLAEEADDVDRPACGCGEAAALDDGDPADAYEEIVESVPDDVLDHLEAGVEPATPAGGD